MKNRRAFLTALTALSSAGLGAVLSAKNNLQAGAAAAAPAKAPSPAALALAATYRAFDPQLTDGDLQTIARGIDDNRKAAAALNPKTKPLRNSDEMVVRFAAAQSVNA